VLQIYAKICRLWESVAKAATPFMCEQTNSNNFEFFGIDVIADESGNCYLLEANRLPGLESSHNSYREQENIMYDTMMTSLLSIVLSPLVQQNEPSSNEPTINMWRQVYSGSDACNMNSNVTFKNIFNWAAFVKKNRKRLHVSIL
jgi:hypothetical protein